MNVVIAEWALAGIAALLGASIVRYFFVKWSDRKRLEDSFLNLFAIAIGNGRPSDTGLDSDYVALWMCGLPTDDRISSLPLAAQAKVLDVSYRLTNDVGPRLVKQGYFKYMNVTFENQGKKQKINAPPSLFLLTMKGQAEVMRRRVEILGKQTTKGG